MNITNKSGIPEPIFRALKADWYSGSKEERFVSATDLNLPAKIFVLKQRHDEEIERDAKHLLKSLLGSAMHKVLEQCGTEDTILEQRLSAEVAGKVISGGVDLYDKSTKKISDFKFTSVETYQYGSRIDEWTQQLNVYGYLYRSAGYEVNSLETILLFRNWMLRDYKEDPLVYPPECVAVPLELWNMAKTENFIANKVREFEEALKLPDDEIPPCTPEERWQRDKYAVMKRGNQRATKVFDTEDGAKRYIEQNDVENVMYVEHREGVPVRCCESFCDCRLFCNFYNTKIKNG